GAERAPASCPAGALVPPPTSWHHRPTRARRPPAPPSAARAAGLPSPGAIPACRAAAPPVPSQLPHPGGKDLAALFRVPEHVERRACGTQQHGISRLRGIASLCEDLPEVTAFAHDVRPALQLALDALARLAVRDHRPRPRERVTQLGEVPALVLAA